MFDIRSMEILDPSGGLVQKWNKIFVFCCVIAISLDPLFLYVPVIDGANKCLNWDKRLVIIACVLRSFTDILYILHIFFQFHTGFIAPSQGFRRVPFIDDRYAIAKRYLLSNFIIDILTVLPLPQVTVLFIIPNANVPVPLIAKDLLKFIICFQYVPRLIRLSLLYNEVTRTSGLFTETVWAGAAFNLFLYMLASHVLGAFWYSFAIEREVMCWHLACERHNCDYKYLYCGGNRVGHYAFLNTSCPLLEPNEIKNSTDFDFGIFLDALQSNMVETRDFSQKFFYSSWWGLQSLSSLGQNLRTSTYVWEILFAYFISILGLLLFSLLIGNMQKYLHSYSRLTLRVEEMIEKRRDAEQLMSHCRLPEDLRVRIRKHEQYIWQKTRGVELDSFINKLPRDLGRDMKRHLCSDLIRRVPMFERVDGQLLDAIFDRLKQVLYTRNSFIIHEGEPVYEMLFIMSGRLSTWTTDGGRAGFYNSTHLIPGDFCGEELFTWALDPTPLHNLPVSTRTAKAITDLEAFSLMSDDLKFVASQFRLNHRKQFIHTFRFYSQQWRTWAACFIQAAWRQHHKRNFEKSLRVEEDNLREEFMKKHGTSQSLGATIYASRFATNALRALRRNHARTALMRHNLHPSHFYKPAEPDSSAKDR